MPGRPSVQVFPLRVPRLFFTERISHEAYSRARPRPSACAPHSAQEKKDKKEEKEVKTKSGLKYVELKEGDGAMPKEGDIVQVHYTGWLTNGKKFDSSVDRRSRSSSRSARAASSRAGMKASGR